MPTPKKISVARLTTESRHTVTVPLTLEDEVGNVEKIDARVVYRGLSMREGAELGKELEGMTVREARIALLSKTVISLPDFVGADGGAVSPDAEFWDTLDTAVLNRINDAIEDDLDPNRKRSSY